MKKIFFCLLWFILIIITNCMKNDNKIGEIKQNWLQFIKDSDYKSANDEILNAARISKYNDPETMFYLVLNNIFENKIDEAINNNVKFKQSITNNDNERDLHLIMYLKNVEILHNIKNSIFTLDSVIEYFKIEIFYKNGENIKKYNELLEDFFERYPDFYYAGFDLFYYYIFSLKYDYDNKYKKVVDIGNKLKKNYAKLEKVYYLAIMNLTPEFLALLGKLPSEEHSDINDTSND